MKAWQREVWKGLRDAWIIGVVLVFVHATIYLWPLFEVVYLLLFGMQGWTP